jgi:hypothetical protein
MNTTESSSDGGLASGCSTVLFLGLLSAALAFVGVGLFMGYRGLTRYLAGAPLTSSAVFVPLLVAVLFLGVVASIATNVQFGSTPEVPDDAPWEARPAWQSSELPELGPTTQQIIAAVVWNLFTFPFAGIVLYTVVWPVEDPGWKMGLFSAFILLFPAIGVKLAWDVLRPALHEWKFGPSTLVMDTMPARPGQPLRARLKAPLSRDALPEAGLHVELARYERYTRSGGEEGSRIQKRQEWQTDATVPPSAVSPEADGISVPISFDLPDSAPPSPPRKTKRRRSWELEATADLPGLDYEVAFEIPVFEPQE